jgi:hypothetical protein
MELPFAAVHQLCAPIAARLSALPEPQQEALSVTLGLSSGHAPDRFIVALAVLSLLSAVAEERPLLCLVDDAQWLDGASNQVGASTPATSSRPQEGRIAQLAREGLSKSDPAGS